MESLIIELYLHIKTYLDYFLGMLKYANLENQYVLNFEFQCQKLNPLILRRFLLLNPLIWGL